MKFLCVRLLDYPFVTKVSDVLSKLLEGGAEAFGVGQNFRGVHHKHHTMDLIFETWLLHKAHSPRTDRLIWAELGERNEEMTLKQRRQNSCCLLACQHLLISTEHKIHKFFRFFVVYCIRLFKNLIFYSNLQIKKRESLVLQLLHRWRSVLSD